MLHTMHFPGFARTHDDALAMASSLANRTFSAIALLSGQRIAQLTTVLLPDPAPSLKHVALVYVLDVPVGGAEILDARRAELVQEVLASYPVLLNQGFFPFRAAISLSPDHRAVRRLGPYTVTVHPESATSYRVLVQLRDQDPHISELCGTLNQCEDYLKDRGLPLDGWSASEAV